MKSLFDRYNCESYSINYFRDFIYEDVASGNQLDMGFSLHQKVLFKGIFG